MKMEKVGMITVKQVAAKLGCSPQYVRRLLGQGRIQGGVKLGRDWAIPLDFKVTDKKG